MSSKPLTAEAWWSDADVAACLKAPSQRFFGVSCWAVLHPAAFGCVVAPVSIEEADLKAQERISRVLGQEQ